MKQEEEVENKRERDVKAANVLQELKQLVRLERREAERRLATSALSHTERQSVEKRVRRHRKDEERD